MRMSLRSETQQNQEDLLGIGWQQERGYSVLNIFKLTVSKNKTLWELPGHPVVRTLRSHCQGPELDPLLGN